ncbi:glycosyltransferase [Paenibacillus polymyxa]|uniref:MGDG synthase family glycosyltransferase n=1 Tax=Paenibacillus polymyxa TaxID=1406 RepID=UPI0025B705EF|nr:glycosyltransferase [Paenibacillus polymyxa]MDN4080321.1 glycosyltransferase [Paenibacillus polymyxa]MDN4083512.1 glycosyltransferase [Paenibacillus polymyxa]MDN4105249.1 glycosyltransferase [Paenibacillus polymyxa]MDN4110417.1 glycosyltransferase [Paenibacillus polymyxa]MDN4115468.1 glycosyltransferase [Paenibacillus polymyxa]
MKKVKKEKILILTGNYGNGHNQVAQALQDAVQIRFPHMEPVVIDFMEWIHPYVNHWSRLLYLQAVKTFPQVYGYLYQKTRKPNALSHIVKIVFSTGIGRMMKLIGKVQPTIVISTFPLAAGVMSKLKSYGLIDIPTVTTITDHTDHSSWIYPYTDQYIVGSKIVRDSLIQLGVEEMQISDTGIPIRPQFSQSMERVKTAKKHGLDPYMPTVLVMGGGCGMIGDGSSTIQEFDQLPQPVQFIIVCGHNEKLRMELSEKLKGSKHRIHLTGYIHYVHELMAVSDIMITKPGGVTTFEAIAMELPMLLCKPIPGQEQDNADFLVRSGVAIHAETSRDLTKRLSKLLNDAKLLQEMKTNTKRFHPKESAFASLEVIFGIVKMNNRVNGINICS